LEDLPYKDVTQHYPWSPQPMVGEHSSVLGCGYR